MDVQKTASLAKMAATKLDITTSTLRRWAIMLEDAGYTFERNERNQRLFNERDHKVLTELKNLTKQGKSLSECVQSVVEGSQHLKQTPEPPPENDQEVRLSRRELQELIEASVEKAVNAEREAMFQAFEHKMNNIVEERDRVLMTQLNQSMEQQRLEIAASKEEESEKENKKSFWSRISDMFGN